MVTGEPFVEAVGVCCPVRAVIATQARNCSTLESTFAAMFSVIGLRSAHGDRRSVRRGSCEQPAFDVDTRSIFYTPR